MELELLIQYMGASLKTRGIIRGLLLVLDTARHEHALFERGHLYFQLVFLLPSVRRGSLETGGLLILGWREMGHQLGLAIKGVECLVSLAFQVLVVILVLGHWHSLFLANPQLDLDLNVN